MSRATRRDLGLGILTLGFIAMAATAMTVRAHRDRDRLMRADPERILGQPDLARTALRIGREGFAAHCATCHGQGGADPARGVPDLTDQDFLYGTGRVGEIEQIVLHGIRSGDPRGWQLASMPAYATPRPYPTQPIPPLTPGGVSDVTQFLMRKHGGETDAAAADRGARLYAGGGGCWDCHSSDAGGDAAIGAPNLVDDVWLYGNGSPAAIARSIADGRAGISPAFARMLAPADARAIAVYVASLPQHRGKDPAHDR
jgi:cytochrome c oxidase cbb3-type subunit 3